MDAEPELITLDVAAQSLGLPIKRVHQLISDGDLVALRGEDGIRRVPAQFLGDGAPVKALPAVITLLRDAHYEDGEIQALRENRGREVKRRAQVAGF